MLRKFLRKRSTSVAVGLWWTLGGVSPQPVCFSKAKRLYVLVASGPAVTPPPPYALKHLPLGPAGPTLTELSQFFRSAFRRTYKTAPQCLEWVTTQHNPTTPKVGTVAMFQRFLVLVDVVKVTLSLD